MSIVSMMVKTTSTTISCVLNQLYVIFLLLCCVPSNSTVEAICPQACDCFPNHVWVCVNVTLFKDILGGSRLDVRDLSLIDVKGLENSTSSSELRHFGASFASVRKLRIQQSIIGSISESFVAAFPNVESVILVDNQFLCGERMMALQKWKRKISRRKDKLHCSSPDGLAGRDVFHVLQTLESVKFECPVPCRCTILSLESEALIPNLIVDCSHQNLEVVPKHMPTSWTIELDLSHNRITDITWLLTMPIYKSVPVLNLSHNHIHNIHLQNISSHMNHFRLLNLANNNLTELPTDLVFDTRSFYYQPLIMLRNNPWMCDCNALKELKKITRQNLVIIGDLRYLQCGSGALAGHSMSSMKVYQTLCQSERCTAFQPIRYANICCFVLVGGLLIKTVYDVRSMYALGIFHWLVDALLPPG